MNLVQYYKDYLPDKFKEPAVLLYLNGLKEKLEPIPYPPQIERHTCRARGFQDSASRTLRVSARYDQIVGDEVALRLQREVDERKGKIPARR